MTYLTNRLALILIAALSFSACAPAPPRPTDLDHSVIIAGDGGSINSKMVYLLVAQAEIAPTLTSVVLLGDNVYPDGELSLRTRQTQASLERFTMLLQSLKDTRASVVLLPGNHDWGASGISPSWKNLITQEAVITKILGPGHYAPRPGCPGPATLNFGSTAAAVIVDSEWLLRRYDGSLENVTHCPAQTVNDFSIQLKNTLERFKDRRVLFFSHHPLKSFGPNSYLKDSFCPQRFSCKAYRAYRKDLSRMLSRAKPLACAAGHDHSLQVIQGDQSCGRYLVSGALSDLHAFQPNEALQFGHAENGLIRLDFYKEGPVRIQVIVPGENNFESKIAFQRLLSN